MMSQRSSATIGLNMTLKLRLKHKLLMKWMTSSG